MVDVAAANVEQPGDGIEQRQQDRVDLVPLERHLHVADFVFRAHPGEFDPVAHDGCFGACGPVLPKRIDWIAGDGLKANARSVEHLGQALDFLDGVQAGVVAHRAAARELVREPFRGLGLRRLQHVEQVGIDLLARLQEVTPVHEQGSGGFQHDGRASRAGETGEPAQTLGGRRQELVLMLVAMGSEETLEFPRLELTPQRLQVGTGIARSPDVIEVLEHDRAF